MDIYVVQSGDTISSIAERYGVSAQKLIQDNELSPNNLVPGQTIVIVYPNQTYTVQDGDSLESIANTYGVTIMQLLRNNPYLSGREYVYPGEIITISYNTGDEVLTNGFVYPYINYDTLRKTLPYLTYLSVFNYSAGKEGEIISYYEDSEIIQIATEYGTVPLLMIATLTPQGEPNIATAYDILLNEEFQDRHINNILNAMKEKGYYGVNMVFNYINTTNQKIYENFISKVSNRLHSEGYLFFATFNLNISNDNGEVIFEKVDYSGINQVVDALIFIQLNWSINLGPPAPVSSIYNLRTFVDYVINYVSPNKTLLGKPIISYDWTLPYVPERTFANSLTLESTLRLAYYVGASILFDETSQTPFFEYTRYSLSRPEEHIVWSIDARSIEAILELVSEYDLGGTGIWSIMVFIPQLWLLINSQYEIIKVIPDNF
jgi:spore germination protein